MSNRSANSYRRLLALLPETPDDVGQVVAAGTDGCTVELLTGALVHVNGASTVGAMVVIQGGAIQGPAPVLSSVEIEV